METVAIGNRVRQFREEAGLSQRKLAPLCGVERTTIGKLEAGKLAPSVELVEAIASVLGVSSADLGEPHSCRCGCGELTFAEYVQGHNPKRQGPYEGRYRRKGLRRHLVRRRLGDRLRCARIKRGWTLKQLATRVGVTLYTLSSIENGHDLPSAELARRLEGALGSEDLFELRSCPCSDECDVLTVGGGFARGHHPLSPESRELCRERKVEWWASDEGESQRSELSEAWTLHWQNGGAPTRGLFEAAKEGRVHLSPEARQAHGRRWGGNTPARGERPRGNQPLSEEMVAAIIARHEKNPRLGVRPIAAQEGLSKSAVADVLREYRAAKVSAKSST